MSVMSSDRVWQYMVLAFVIGFIKYLNIENAIVDF
jgi:hypothetical protein